MRAQNIHFLQNFTTYASLAGVFNVFIGLMVIIMDAMNQDWRHIQVGIYILVTGYAFVKSSQMIGNIVLEELKLNAIEANKKQKEKEKNNQDLDPPHPSTVV